MPPPLLFDLSTLDLNKVVATHDDIYKIIPQRFEMEQLSAIVYESHPVTVGYKDVRHDEFWVRGHIPGRPLMPGVLQIESAAQLCAYVTMKAQPQMGFVGFARCNDVIFRGTVLPGSRLYMIAHTLEMTRRRAVAKCQGVVNGVMVFEAVITGMSI